MCETHTHTHTSGPHASTHGLIQALGASPAVTLFVYDNIQKAISQETMVPSDSDSAQKTVSRDTLVPPDSESEQPQVQHPNRSGHASQSQSRADSNTSQSETVERDSDSEHFQSEGYAPSQRCSIHAQIGQNQSSSSSFECSKATWDVYSWRETRNRVQNQVERLLAEQSREPRLIIRESCAYARSVSARLSVWVRVCVYVLPMYVCVCVCVYIYIYIHIYTCVCIYIYMYIYIYVYIHVYISACTTFLCVSSK